MSMTKKDFVAVAELLNSQRDLFADRKSWHTFIEETARVLKRTNSSFNTSRFYLAAQRGDEGTFKCAARCELCIALNFKEENN